MFLIVLLLVIFVVGHLLGHEIKINHFTYSYDLSIQIDQEMLW